MTKKFLAGALASMMILSSASALACNNDSFISYDIANAQGRYGKLYYCPELGRTIVNGYAETVEWVHAFYEAEYPHKEVQTLVLDGKKTGLTRYSGNFANAEVKLVADFWEAKAPYDVYHRLYSNLNKAGYKATDIIGYAGVQEDVDVSMPVMGFDRYAIVDGKVMNYEVVYNALQSQIQSGPAAPTTLDQLIEAYYAAVTNPDGTFTQEFLEGRAGLTSDEYIRNDVNASPIYSIFNDAIPQYAWEKLEGPDYYTGATQTIVPMKLLGEKLDAISKGKADWNEFHPEYYDDVIAKKVANTKNVEWVTVGYEKVYPYRIYQVLKVNGVLLDGSAVETPALGQEKIGEKVVANYDVNILNGIDNIYTVDKFEVAKRPAEEHFDLINEKNEVITNSFIVDDYIDEYDDIIRVTADVMVDKATNLPYVFRYTGGFANPKVEWKVAWPEAEYPYTIYEEKYLDGKATGIYRSTETHAQAIPEVYEANPQIGNGIRVLKVTLTGDNIQDACLHEELLNKGYEFIVSGDRETYWRIPEILYKGHEFKGSQSFYFGPNDEYVTKAIVAGWADAQQALLNK